MKEKVKVVFIVIKEIAKIVIPIILGIAILFPFFGLPLLSDVLDIDEVVIEIAQKLAINVFLLILGLCVLIPCIILMASYIKDKCIEKIEEYKKWHNYKIDCEKELSEKEVNKDLSSEVERPQKTKN